MRHLPLILAVVVHAAFADTGSVPLTSHGGTAWYLSLSVGTPPNTFTALVSTGISDLILPGQDCHNCDGHTLFDTGSSSTSQDLGLTFNTTSGSGNVFTDTISIGGITATEQAMGVATQYSKNMTRDQSPADGLLGLGFKSLDSFGQSPLMRTLIAQGQLSEPVFSLKLVSGGSELFLGGKNGDLYTGEITYSQVTEENSWTVMLDSININKNPAIFNHKATIDSGSSLIILSPSDAKEFFNNIPGSRASSVAGDGYYAYPCNSTTVVSLTFGGKSFDIAPDKFNMGSEEKGSSFCIAGIVGKESGLQSIVVGSNFLTNVYTIFDIGNKRVGFASLA
ncbi:hypothetical protein DFQ27_004970 [Actinomortierella ambigua]|uniref:Peptidase A1 domain-containing protein n=1 Tax=Actinomortierella ambigua TaxID=1343610 RepID=A0A9P6UBB6_9FUNG|nr:hypothetical protein DFQ27_004970 [Actinomortierella ambigua]